jgi:uncharacterized protein YxeA
MPNDGDTIFNNSEINGEWKALFYYGMTNVMELKKLEIMAGDRAATVNVYNKYVKVHGSYREDSTPKYALEGAVDSGSLTAYSQSGKLELYVFYTYNHYNDFQEYLNYAGGWGEKFGNITGGGKISSTTDYNPTDYVEVYWGSL